MENSKTQEKIINLGKLLVAELEEEPRTDFLSRWMAHYLAEQITHAESAKGHAKIAARKKCFETILILWKHRASFPNGRRPFEKFEPVLEALSSLSPDNPHPYYHRFKPGAKESNSKESILVSQLIDVIFAIDAAARIMVETALSELTRLATNNKTKALLKNSMKVRKGDSVGAVRILIQSMEDLDARTDPAERLNQERLEKLQEFTRICKPIERLLKSRLKKKP